MQSRDIEEVFQSIQEGSYELTDFKTWLALWSVKVIDMFEESQRDHDEFFGKDSPKSGHQ
jgi:hypothetical protein